MKKKNQSIYRKPHKIHKNKYSVSYKQPVTSNSVSKNLTSSIVSKEKKIKSKNQKVNEWRAGKWVTGGVWRERAWSLQLLCDAIVYIDSVTVRELFVLTVERPSQQAILTTSAPTQPCTVRIGWCVRRGGPKASATPRRRRFLFLLCRATYAFDMRIKGWKLHSCNTATLPPPPSTPTPPLHSKPIATPSVFTASLHKHELVLCSF